MRRFEYFEAKTLQETCSLLTEYDGKANIIAGGTALIKLMKKRLISPGYLVNIKRIPGLDFLNFTEDEGLKIGPLVTFSQIEGSDLVKERFPVISYMAHQVGSVPIRNMGTLAGNLCFAESAADPGPLLTALNAEVKIFGLSGKRTISIKDFFLDYYSTVLKSNEVLVEVCIPKLQQNTGVAYKRFTIRKAFDLSLVNAACVINIDSHSQICNDVKIVLGGNFPKPFRAEEAEDLIRGEKISPNLIAQSAAVVSKKADPVSDFRASAEYRKEIIKVLVDECLNEAWMAAKRH